MKWLWSAESLGNFMEEVSSSVWERFSDWSCFHKNSNDQTMTQTNWLKSHSNKNSVITVLNQWFPGKKWGPRWARNARNPQDFSMLKRPPVTGDARRSPKHQQCLICLPHRNPERYWDHHIDEIQWYWVPTKSGIILQEFTTFHNHNQSSNHFES